MADGDGSGSGKTSNVQGDLQAILDRVLGGALSYHVLAGMLGDLVNLAKAERVPQECDIQHEAPYDFAWCETHDTTFALGTTCKFNGRWELDVLQEELDKARARMLMAEESLVEMKRLVPDPPSGWYRFGTHSGWETSDLEKVRLLFSDETGDDGLPLWERPSGA